MHIHLVATWPVSRLQELANQTCTAWLQTHLEAVPVPPGKCCAGQGTWQVKLLACMRACSWVYSMHFSKHR